MHRGLAGICEVVNKSILALLVVPQPSAPSWSPGGTHLWQRSPLSGIMRRWFTSPISSKPHWFAPDFLHRFGPADFSPLENTPVMMVVDKAGRVVQGGR